MIKLIKRNFDKLNTNKTNLILNYLTIAEKFVLLSVSKKIKTCSQIKLEEQDIFSLLGKVRKF